jgi:hypothetical protein
MASVLCNVSLCLEHAQEARALSEVISDPEEKEQMVVVAAGFDRIAELAQEHATFKVQYQLPN